MKYNDALKLHWATCHIRWLKGK